MYREVIALVEQPEAVARSVAYVTEHMLRFLREKDKVLICFPKRNDACCRILEQAILNCKGEPIWIGEDRRWITLMKTAFTSKCNCIIAPPLMLLGLSKVANHMGVPLFVRNVLVSGYPSTEWMVKGIEKGLDCKVWGCFDPGLGAVISGFSCGYGMGVHIRSEEYGIEILDELGNPLPEGMDGRIEVYPKANPSLRISTGSVGRIDGSPCPCGIEGPRLLNLDVDKRSYKALSDTGEQLHYWSSILDCRLERSECGLELEAVVFRGEKLPKFPSCAKLIIRPWNPDEDVPFDHHGVLKNKLLSGFDH